MKEFTINDMVTLNEGPGGLDHLVVENRHARAVIFTQGAHVASFIPTGGKDLLWMSPLSPYLPGKALRGGIPLCWPWFSAHTSDKSLPSHGFARILPWQLASTAEYLDGSTRLELVLESSPETKKFWPWDFRAELFVTVGPTLDLELRTTNTGAEPFRYEEALHTYFAVSDVRQVRIEGFDGVVYKDRAQSDAFAVQQGDYIPRVETTYLYMDDHSRSVIHDGAAGRSIVISKEGSACTAVWNPFETGAAKMAEVGPHWSEFVCVESANFLEKALFLAPGYSHSLCVSYGQEAGGNGTL